MDKEGFKVLLMAFVVFLIGALLGFFISAISLSNKNEMESLQIEKLKLEIQILKGK